MALVVCSETLFEAAFRCSLRARELIEEQQRLLANGN
jgi:hypothetical protein